jgi:hypothetical protein
LVLYIQARHQHVIDLARSCSPFQPRLATSLADARP